MCYTIEKNLTREQLEKRFGSKFKPNRPYSPGKRVSAFTLPELPVICAPEISLIDVQHWGLIPFWTKSMDDAKSIRTKTFNARAETLIQKPSFRHTIKNQRCLVLSNGFYEWQHIGNDKIPHFIRLREDIAMPMAGLYDSWTDKETGEVLNTFTIITTAANPLMEKIHNTKKRMPVILQEDAEKAWIDPSLNAEQAMKHLTQLNENLMIAEVVEKEPGKQKKKDDQQTLF